MEITPEIQAAIDAAVETATEGLKKKNKELLEREKTAKKNAEEAEAAATEAADKAGDVETLRTQLEKKHKNELDKLNEKIASQSKRLSEVLIDAEVANAIAAAGVKSTQVRAVTLLLKDGVEMVDGNPVVNGVAFKDHIAAWMKSDEAMEFVAAPNNTGAGAPGSTAVASAFKKAPETADEWNSFYKFSAENAAAGDALLKQWGLS